MRGLRVKRQNLPAFGMSFLDVMACGFAAAVLLLVLAKENVQEEIPEDPAVVAIAADPNSDRVEQLSDELKALNGNAQILASRIAELQAQEIQDEIEIEELKRRRSSLRSRVNASSLSSAVPTLYESGIPVGYNYVLFIVDTSGSMKQHWKTVVDTLTKILEMHPRVTGLQILDDNGGALIKGYEGIWIPDTKAARKSALSSLNQMGGFSNSSPAEGLEKALKTYAKPQYPTSVYVLGDDFTGSSYDAVLAVVNRWNNSSSGQPKAVIHGIGFPWGLGARFSPLMKEVSRSSGGVFIGL